MSGAMINTRLIAERRNALNMSRRALNKAAAVGHHAIHADDPGAHAHASMTLGELSRVAAALGLTAAELLTAPDATADRPPTPDAAVLVAALMDEVHIKLVFRDDLARAFGWPLERVHAAVREAAVHLPAVGLDIHQIRGLRVHVAHGVLTDDVQQRLARAKTLRRHMRLDAARVLREVAHGRGDARGLMVPSNKQRVPIQGLRKRDLIEDTPTGLVLTATAAYSLMLTDEPPAEPLSRPAGAAQPPIGGWLRPPRPKRQ
jgi:hypothetical protein